MRLQAKHKTWRVEKPEIRIALIQLLHSQFCLCSKPWLFLVWNPCWDVESTARETSIWRNSHLWPARSAILYYSSHVPSTKLESREGISSGIFNFSITHIKKKASIFHSYKENKTEVKFPLKKKNNSTSLHILNTYLAYFPRKFLNYHWSIFVPFHTNQD